MYYACPVSIPDNERKKKKLDLTEDRLFFFFMRSHRSLETA